MAAKDRPISAPDGDVKSQCYHPQTLVGLSNIKRSPQWSFNGRRQPPALRDGPGPGTYGASTPETTSRFNKSPLHSFPHTPRHPSSKGGVPGPGAYEEQPVIGGGKAYSLTPRRFDKPREELPGPGAHEINTHIGEGPKFTATTRRNGPRKGLVPGPGEYNQSMDATLDKNPTWGFGTSRRPNRGDNGIPGPGTYGQGSAVGEGPKFSMQARRGGSRPPLTPGPGAHGAGLFTTFAQ